MQLLGQQPRPICLLPQQFAAAGQLAALSQQAQHRIDGHLASDRVPAQRAGIEPAARGQEELLPGPTPSAAVELRREEGEGWQCPAIAVPQGEMTAATSQPHGDGATEPAEAAGSAEPAGPERAVTEQPQAAAEGCAMAAGPASARQVWAVFTADVCALQGVADMELAEVERLEAFSSRACLPLDFQR